MKTIDQIRTDFNDAISGSWDRNERVIDDIRFAKVPGAQWYGSDREQYQNKPKPENNKIARQINRILGQYMRLDMNAKIISASDEATDEDAELLQSRWRNDFNSSDGIEAIQNAADEAFHGGFGAFKLVARHEDEEAQNDDYQNLSIEPIYSAASSVVFNAGALRKDKRDAKQGWNLIRVNRAETEAEFGVSIAPFPEVTADYNYFDWYCDNTKDVYIAHYYEVVKRRVTEYEFANGLKIYKEGRKYRDQFGEKFDKEMLDELKENVPFEEETKTVQQVEYALITGDTYLIKPQKTPFKTIPIIPQYGYHQVINGIEFYCGEVCRQRDNQRFLNMGFSSMMEILAQPQTATPEYAPEQIQRFATQRAEHTKKNFPYLMSDPITDKDGNILQMGPLAIHQPPQLGTGLAGALEFLNQNITEQGGTGQSTLPANTSGEAIQQVNQREDDSYQPMFQNAMQSLKAACETWIPAAQKLYFSNERKLRLEGPDGSYSQVKTMQYMLDEESGEYGPFMNSARGRYDVSIRVGEGHQTQKDADRRDNLEILQFTDTATPEGQMVLNNLILSTTGEGTEDSRRIARFKNLAIMLQMGIDPQPKTQEEREYLQQIIQQMQAAAQNQQPDPATQAMLMEGQARMMEGQATLIDKQVDQFNAETKRMDTVVKAQKAGADINKLNAETAKTFQSIEDSQLDNAQKIVQMTQPRRAV